MAGAGDAEGRDGEASDQGPQGDGSRADDWPPGGAAAFLPPEGMGDLAALAAAAATCRGCPLWKSGTRTVFGEGPQDARLVLVGEAPGDVEDRMGRPFVGPAGRLLGRALVAAGIPREAVYLSNAVKHFKWRPGRGRRVVRAPAPAEIAACRPWIEAELARIAPRVLVCLGAVAAQSLLGPDVRVTRDRGRRIASPWAPATFVTVHPSAVLRPPDPEIRDRNFAALAADLAAAAAHAGG